VLKMPVGDFFPADGDQEHPRTGCCANACSAESIELIRFFLRDPGWAQAPAIPRDGQSVASRIARRAESSARIAIMNDGSELRDAVQMAESMRCRAFS